MNVYMAITADKYELPICIADTGKELAQILEIPVDHVYSAIHKNLNGQVRGYRMIKVDIGKSNLK